MSSVTGQFAGIYRSGRIDTKAARDYRVTVFRYLVIFSFVSGVAIAGSFAAFASSNGITNVSGAPSQGNCNGCHFGGAAAPSVTISGPSTVAPSSTNTYTFQLDISSAASNSVVGGLDVSAPLGTLSVLDAGTKLSNGEITHSAPKNYSANGALSSVSWQFKWTAPSSEGSYTIYGAGIGGDGNGFESGDAGGTGTKSVTVAVPDTTPPVLQITTPNTPTFNTTLSTIDIAGTASDNVGVTQVTWNNLSGGSGLASGTTSWSVNGIALKVGNNVIKVVAKDAAGNMTTDMITVTRNAASSQNGSFLTGIRYLLFFGK